MDRQDFTISLTIPHRICFTHDAFSLDNPLLHQLLAEGKGRRAIVILEKAIAQAWPALPLKIEQYFSATATQLCAIEILTGGEACKANQNTMSHIWELVNQYQIDRHSYILCIGGGALLDAVGLGAATAHRGVRFLRFPTTTLSQDDSGVGVKNGINHFHKKNWVGTFAVPYAVINDFDFLSSQDPASSKAGLIEAIKVALVRDAEFFHWIEKNATALRDLAPAALEECVKRSALLHAQHIAQGGDPFENGSSRPLDFGHWIAHKLEQLSGFQISHADAVSIGLAHDVLYSEKIGLLDSASAQRIIGVLREIGLPLTHKILLENENGTLKILAGLEEFREHLGGQLTVLLLEKIGKGIDTHEMNPHIIEECILKMLS